MGFNNNFQNYDFSKNGFFGQKVPLKQFLTKSKCKSLQKYEKEIFVKSYHKRKNIVTNTYAPAQYVQGY